MHPRIKAAKLLFYNLAGGPGSSVRAERCSTPQGTPYDLYQPSGEIMGTVILVYGFDLAGEQDGRLVRFARACARSGLRAAAPVLPGLKSFRLDAGDLEALVDLVSELHQRHQTRVGLIGFSIGGSYAMLTAGDRRVAEWVDPVLAFSACYSLEEMLHTQTRQLALPPGSPAEWDHLIWIQLILAYRNLERLGLAPETRQELLDLLYRYCDERIEPKLDFYQRVLRHCPSLDVATFGAEAGSFDRFSLPGKLEAIRGRVLLLHDPDDLLVAPEHSQHIYRELQRRPAPARQRLLVTRLIAHVVPRYGLRWREIIETLDQLGELFVG